MPLAEAYSDVASSIGAFLSGFGSVLTAYLGIRFERKRSAEECELRMAALREGYKARRR